jgi:predicted Zn-dependent protease
MVETDPERKRSLMRPMPLCLLLILPLVLTGCGSSHHQPSVPLPSSFATITPNYGGDLNSANYWPNTPITYRFVDPASATDIRLNPISAVAATDDQKNAVRDALAEWQAALAQNAAGGQRTFVETSATDTTADIDIVMQTKDQFETGTVSEEWGFTDFYLKDVDKGLLGRAVMRLRNDLSSSNFRYIALHEEGHALGIDGHSRRLGTVMYPIQISILPVNHLTTYDINTIRASYTR